MGSRRATGDGEGWGREDAEEMEPDSETLDAIAPQGERWPLPPEWRTAGGGRQHRSGGRRSAQEQGSEISQNCKMYP